MAHKKAECESSLKRKQINVFFFPKGISVLVYMCAVDALDGLDDPQRSLLTPTML